ncbi:MAG: polyprenol monophosphomannose synthase [Candidatus Aenigmarchaeota archaeon]|nr:polyprenol monophosphomannose synthase [Candidatus Aenigmarchaeota archaeon]
MITVILPTYNEAENIENVVKNIRKTGAEVNILIIDDNSPDGTGKLADIISKKYKSVSVVHRKNKAGLGSAIKNGFEACSGIVGVMDADMSHDPSIIPDIIKEFGGGADFVIGSRYAKTGGIERWPFYRKLASRVATAIAKPLTPVKDPVSGYFFIKKSVINGMKINPESCKICLDILVRGGYKNVVEVPYTFRNRPAGKTKILNVKEVLKYIKYVSYLYKYRIARCFR